MDDETTYECAICYFRGNAKEFTPVTVSADFSALECPKCLNDDPASFDLVADEGEDLI